MNKNEHKEGNKAEAVRGGMGPTGMRIWFEEVRPRLLDKTEV